ncbi:LytR/AlgR family response regulator transcription factor [Phnomibacter ginsenosidimutans]|uniref:Response regulator n=1 Tax=Phnomibacter ginsenosidimutans TaxID=2676868 RepID=A0A6I6GLU0_9BACT|nr:LytTR family DNA-binding domain-containing protein [Phnomibacter ginsenosidimutans]QGW29455.1 response regulator [Phnomibacter ginsenosidimutans]
MRLTQTFRNVHEAMAYLQSNKVDLVFLDVQMPGLSGITLANNLKGKTPVILLTAYDTYAVEAYGLDVLDYLLKPVAFDRFLQSCFKAYEWYNRSGQPVNATLANRTVMDAGMYGADSDPRFLFVHVDYNLVRIELNDILYIEAFKDYVKIFLESSARPVVTRMSMKVLEERLGHFHFVRIHKSYIVSLTKITALQKGLVSMGRQELPISEGFRDKLSESIKRMNVL